MKTPTFVLIDGIVFPFTEKAPFSKSGFSLKGALEYDDKSDLIRCHECGNWYKALATHLDRSHKMNTLKYKLRHCLLPRTALIAEKTRAKLIHANRTEFRTNILRKVWFRKTENGGNKGSRYPGGDRLKIKDKFRFLPTEELNKRRICPEQVVELVKKVAAAVGRTPTTKELHEHGFRKSYIKYYYGGIGGVCKIAGIQVGKPGARKMYRREQLIQFLKLFFKNHGRTPSRSDCRRGILPSTTMFYREFGSWNAALRLAGLPLNYLGIRFWGKRKLIHSLNAFKKEYGHFPSIAEWSSWHTRIGAPSIRVFNRCFGRWSAAIEFAKRREIKLAA